MKNVKIGHVLLVILLIVVLVLGVRNSRLSETVRQQGNAYEAMKRSAMNAATDSNLKQELLDQYEVEKIMACEHEVKETLLLKYYTEKQRDVKESACSQVKDMPKYLQDPQKWYEPVEIQTTYGTGIEYQRVQYNKVVAQKEDTEEEVLPAEKVVEKPVVQKVTPRANTYTIPE